MIMNTKINPKTYFFSFQMQGIGIKTSDQGILPASKDIGRRVEF